MIDIATLKGWVDKLGWDAELEGDSTLRVRPRSIDLADLPPFYVQSGENWVLLSILPILPPDAEPREDLPRRLLSMNRDMRLAKFALGQGDEVVLCAELPTESLDYSELADAAKRMVGYYKHYKTHFA